MIPFSPRCIAVVRSYRIYLDAEVQEFALKDRGMGAGIRKAEAPILESHTLHWRAVALLMTGNYLEGYPAYNTFVPPAKNEPVLNWRGPHVSTLLAGKVPL
jgi:hypothetical protein